MNEGKFLDNFETLFNDPQSHHLGAGLNNITRLNGSFVLRKKVNHDGPFYDPFTEHQIFKRAAELLVAPELLYFSQTNGDMVTHYLKGYEPFLNEEVKLEELLPLIKHLKTIHSFKLKEIKPFDLENRLRYYKEEVAGPLSEKEEEVLQVFLKINSPLVVSHNDIVRGNVLRNKEGDIKLIDFEFSGLNIPEFDLASLIGENNLRSPELIKGILKAYYGEEYSPKKWENVQKTIKVSDILWHYWALYRYKTTPNPIFLEIAEEKATHFEK